MTAFLFFTFSAGAQPVLNRSEYMKKIETAGAPYREGNCTEAATAYADAFAFNEQNFSEVDR